MIEKNNEVFKDQEAKRNQAAKNEMERQKAQAQNLTGLAKLTAGVVGETAAFNKAAAIVQATIDTYTGATKAFAQQGVFGFVSGALIVAAGLANVARIASQQVPSGQINIPTFNPKGKFKDGVIDLEGPGTATSDSIPAYLSRGESVMTAKETRDFLPTLKAIRKGDIDAELLNGMSKGGPRVIDASRVIEVPRDHFTLDENGFSARVVRTANQTTIKQNRYAW